MCISRAEIQQVGGGGEFASGDVAGEGSVVRFSNEMGVGDGEGFSLRAIVGDPEFNVKVKLGDTVTAKIVVRSQDVCRGCRVGSVRNP
jgi:hypothetical protein